MPAVAVLVTGASTGIGEACALRLDRVGHRVFAGVRRAADAERLRASASQRLVPVELDVTDAAAIDACRGRIAAAVGDAGLHGVVNNAGVAIGGPVEFLDLEAWRRQLEVNVVGQVAVTKALLPLVRTARGRIVFIGSSSGRVSIPLMAPYGASKHALEAIAESLRHELRPDGVRVSLIEPGAVKTAIWDKGRALADEMERALPAEARTRYARFIAAVRKGIDYQERVGIDPAVVARAVEHALFARRPRARVLVGTDAKLQGILARLFPDPLRDQLVRRFVGF